LVEFTIMIRNTYRQL